MLTCIHSTVAAILLALCLISCAQALDAPSEDSKKGGGKALKNEFITLGTRGGPITSAKRSQPANALLIDDKAYLVDVGDGTAGQLAKAGIPLDAVQGIFISHLHFDHTGGLAAILGLRYQTSARHPLTIYGPPGTKETVEGLFQFMAPMMRAGYAVPGAPPLPSPQDKTIIIEMSEGKPIDIDGMRITAIENTHFSFKPGSKAHKENKSFAFRFDLKDRSIVFTGDTGPSENVEKLAKGADLLVSEMMDIDFTMENLKRSNTTRKRPVPEKVLAGIYKHLRDHHVTAKQVGEMAKRAGVKSVVVTHFSGKEDAQSLKAYTDEIAKNFTGKAIIADDLQRF